MNISDTVEKSLSSDTNIHTNRNYFEKNKNRIANSCANIFGKFNANIFLGIFSKEYYQVRQLTKENDYERQWHCHSKLNVFRKRRILPLIFEFFFSFRFN